MYLRLREDGPEFPIGHDLLLSLADALNLKNGYPALTTALLELGIPSLNKELIDKVELNTEQMDRLWDSGDLETRRTLLYEREFIRKLTDNQAQDILAADDIPMLRQLARWCELLEGDLSGQRLSPAMRDRLWLHLRRHADRRILEELADNNHLPDAIAIPVDERLRLGLPIDNAAFRALRQDEIPALFQAPLSTLMKLAEHTENIRDPDVYRTVLERLAGHPDPAVRLALAEYTTDADILTTLAADPDPDIRAKAEARHPCHSRGPDGVKEKVMMYLRLREDGPEFPIGYGLLLSLAGTLRRRNRYPELTTALLELGIPSLTEKLLNMLRMETEQRDRLWDSGNLETRRALLDNTDFIRELTDNQAQDILAADDIPMLRQLARWCELLEGDLSGQRLSPAMRDRLWLHLRRHADRRILEELADNNHLPDAIAIPVDERLRLGLPIDNAAFRALRQDEIPALFQAPLSTLMKLAEHTENIRDPDVYRTVLERLAAHPDPAVRLALAEHTTDADILTTLAADPDPGIRATAEVRLAHLCEDETED